MSMHMSIQVSIHMSIHMSMHMTSVCTCPSDRLHPRRNQSVLLNSNHRIMSHTEFVFFFVLSQALWDSVRGLTADPGSPRQGGKHAMLPCNRPHRSTQAFLVGSMHLPKRQVGAPSEPSLQRAIDSHGVLPQHCAVRPHRLRMGVRADVGVGMLRCGARADTPYQKKRTCRHLSHEAGAAATAYWGMCAGLCMEVCDDMASRCKSATRPLVGAWALAVAVLHWWPHCTGGCIAFMTALHKWPYCTDGRIALMAVLH